MGREETQPRKTDASPENKGPNLNLYDEAWFRRLQKEWHRQYDPKERDVWKQ